MIVVWIILGLLAALTVVYLAVLIRPRRAKAPKSALLCPYAHRGLHGRGIAENSLAAFEAACQEHVGIELDVQLSRDGVVMVFHDDTLGRMTGDGHRLCDVDADELQRLSLAGTDSHIPTFRQVLTLVAGRVPLLVELKGESFDTALCEKVATELRDYAGDYCIESFNPLLVRGMRAQLPHTFCGLLYTNVCREKRKRTLLNMLLTAMALNVVARPDFIAYDKQDRTSLPVRITTRLYRAPRFVWTVRSDEEMALAHTLGECPIFERE